MKQKKKKAEEEIQLARNVENAKLNIANQTSALIGQLVEKDALRLYNVSNSVCDHKVRTADGMVVSFRNTCEICGKNMRAKWLLTNG